MKTKCKYCKKPVVFGQPVTNNYCWHDQPLRCPWCNRKLKNPPPNKTYWGVFKGRCEE